MLQRLDGRCSRQRPQCEYAARVRVIAQIRAHLRLDAGRISAGVERGGLEVDSECVSKAAATFERCRVGRIVVYAKKRFDARGFRLFTGGFTRCVFRLADMHDRAEIRALLFGARIDRDERNMLFGDLGDRALQHVVVGDGDDHAVVIARRSLFDQTGHVGNVAVRRIAVVGLDVEVFVSLFDGVLDGVPPGIRVWCVADQYEVRIGSASCRCGC